ncbi:MAG: DUF3841 domain-containing protein [Tissierellia bacterium]|nr:DUF3841 domain-containing protein [Tissierellia bacterium]
MAEKIVSRPKDVEFPIWCSISTRNCLRPIEKEVVYCLEVPENHIIYFDGYKWDYVLNYLYIPKNEEDEKAYQKQIKELPVTDEFNFIRGKYKGQYPFIEKKIRESWTRIFEIEEWNDFKVQGNIWEIKKEWVKKIVLPGDSIE